MIPSALLKLGVHTRLTDEVEPWKIKHTLQLVREMGAPWIVEYFPWAYHERFPGFFDWRHSDLVIDHANQQGLTVIVAALYSHGQLLTWNRANLPNYFEVYLRVPMETLRQRDSKGLYRRASEGMNDVVGVDIPWHAPTGADLVIDTDGSDDPFAIAQRIVLATGMRPVAAVHEQ